MNWQYKVIFIKKNSRFNVYEQITHVGGLTDDYHKWCITQNDAINGIECGRWSFFVKKNGSPIRIVVARTPSGKKYLKAEVDADLPELLLSLPHRV